MKLLTVAVCFVAGAALAQTPGTTIVRPGVTDASLAHHKPWLDSDLQNPSGYLTLTPTGGGPDSDRAQLQAAFDNSATIPVMLKGGKFDTCHMLLRPFQGIVVAENSLPYDPYHGTEPNTYLQCSGGPFSGTSYIRVMPRSGDGNSFGFMRGVAVDGNYAHYIRFNGYIAGSVLTVTSVTTNNLNPGLVPWMDLRDNTGALAANTKIRSQTSGTTGLAGTYTIWPSQTVGSSTTPVTMGGVVHCIEHYANASFTQVEDLYLVRCTGDGYAVVGDAGLPGGQGNQFGNGYTIRPIIHGGFFSLNDGSGLNIGVVGGGGAASDIYVDRQLNSSSNANNDFNGQSAEVRIFGSTGTITDLRTEFGPCGLVVVNSDALLINHFFSDNDGCFFQAVNSSGELQGRAFQRSPGGGTAIQLYNSGFQLNGVTVSVGGGGYAATIQADSSSGVYGSLSPPVVYADLTTKGVVAPSLTRSVGGNTPLNVTLTGATFAAPDLLTSDYSVFALTGTGCAGGAGGHCQVPNPEIAPRPGMSGTLEVQQPATGTATIAWGSSYKNPPVLSTTSGSIDFVPWVASSTGSIILEAPNQNKLVTTSIVGHPNLLSIPPDYSPPNGLGGGTRAGGQPDPDGGTAGIIFTEDGPSAPAAWHGFGQTGLALAPGVYTVSGYFGPGSGGAARQPVIFVSGTNQTNDISFNFGCGVSGSDGPGISGPGCVSAPNGYIRIWFTIDTTGSGSTTTDVNFLQAPYPGAGAESYPGDGASNLKMWGPLMRAGNTP
jgi:hypothetical protein